MSQEVKSHHIYSSRETQVISLNYRANNYILTSSFLTSRKKVLSGKDVCTYM